MTWLTHLSASQILARGFCYLLYGTHSSLFLINLWFFGLFISFLQPTLLYQPNIKKKKITFLFLFSSLYIRYNNNNNNTIASILKSSILSLSHTHKKYRDDSESTAKLAGMDFTSPSSQTRPSFHFQFQEVIKSS